MQDALRQEFLCATTGVARFSGAFCRL